MRRHRINSAAVRVRSLSQLLPIVLLLSLIAGASTGWGQLLPEPVVPLTPTAKEAALGIQTADNAMPHDGSLEVRQVLIEAAKIAASVPDQKGDSKREKDLQSRKEGTLFRIANARARAGDAPGALNTFENGNLLQVSRTVAIVQARNGNPKDAAKTFPLTQFKHDRMALREIIVAFLRTGDSASALEIAGENAILLGFIARQQAFIGDSSHKELFRKAINRINSSRGRDRQYSVSPLLLLAKFQAQAGDRQESQDTLKVAIAVLDEVRRWTDDDYYVKVLQNVATTQWELGNHDEGIKAFERALDACGILPPHVQIWEMMNIANTFMKLGEPVRAKSVIERIRVTSGKFPQSEQINALDRIAGFQAGTSDWDGALSTFEQAIAITKLMDAPSKSNPMARELKAVGVSAIVGTQSRERFSISKAAAEAGLFDVAFEVANSMEESQLKANVLRIIAFELVKVKTGDELEQGLQALSRSVEGLMPNAVSLVLFSPNNNMLIELAAIQAALGDVKTALRLAGAANSNMQQFVYGSVLGMLGAKGDFVGAQQVYGEMEHEIIYLDGLYAKLRSHATRGYHKRALAWAREQVSPLIQANALAGSAEGMMDVAGVPVIKPFGAAEEW